MTNAIMTDEEVQVLADSGFTKGQWIAEGEDILILDPNDPKFFLDIAQVTSNYGDKGLPKDKVQENLANTKVIAAAPRLLATIQDRDATIKEQAEELERLTKETVTVDGWVMDFDEWVSEVSEGNFEFGSPLEKSTFTKFAGWHDVQKRFEDGAGIYPTEADYFTDCGWLVKVPVTQTQINNEEVHVGAEVGDDYWHTTSLGYSMSVIGDAALLQKFTSQCRDSQALANKEPS